MELNQDYTIRVGRNTDEACFKDMLYHAIHLPEGAQRLDRNIVETPELARYYADWGKETDCGSIAEIGGKPIAAAWIRLFSPTERGYGYIDETIPELSMATIPEYRGQGIGSRLLEHLLDLKQVSLLPALSLSVDRTNRALNLYRRFGFQDYSQTEKSLVMIKVLNMD